jgi:putative ABC transport system permease protein
MNIGQAFIEALESLTANKLRSGLTILGIVIGVAAVIAMMAVGQGAQNSIVGSINGIGSNLVFIIPGNRQVDVRNPQRLTTLDSNALADPMQAPSLSAVSPVVQGNAEVAAAGEKRTTQIMGVEPNYEQVRNATVDEGDFINQDQVLGRASVAIIGVDTADKLFGRKTGLVGETVRISGQPFRIIGVLTPKGGGSFGSQDDVILVPISSASSRLFKRDLNQVNVIYAQAADSDHVQSAIDEITDVLRTRHHNEYGSEDFTVMSQKDILTTVSSITGVLTIFLGGIAAISLLVGGIGIMNIMLVSVTERTREIGLRKALGARKRDILLQFLTESSLLSLLGGVLGIALGWLISFAIGKIAAATGNNFTPDVGLNAILLAVIFSTAVGLFFGIYPSNRAASLEPVEALRYE